MKTEFQNQIKLNNTEWEKRLEAQKKNDEDLDKRLKEQDKRTKTAVETKLTSVKTYFEKHKTTHKRKLDSTIDIEQEEEDDEDMNREANNTRMALRSKVETTDRTISSLQERLGEQERAIMANSQIVTRAMKQKIEKL